MKFTFAVLAFVSSALAQEDSTPPPPPRNPSTTCLNCKLLDSRASFLYTYSYCAATDKCLADEWNYINAWCTSKWIPGWQLDIDGDCASKEEVGKCLPVVSSE